MSTPQTSGIGEPTRGTVSRTGPKSTAGSASVRWTSVDGTRGTSETSSKSNARGMSSEQLADRLGWDGRDGLHHCIVEYSPDERAC